MSTYVFVFLARRARTYPMPITLRKMAAKIIAGDY